jgi:hypothetical protein
VDLSAGLAKGTTVAYFDTPEHADAGRRFVSWFNDLNQSDRRDVTAAEGPHDAIADWVNQAAGTSPADYDRVAVLHSHGVVEFGDDGCAHLRMP